MANRHDHLDRWISPRDRVAGARMRLFCLPHAGAGASAYQAWKRELPPFVELCAIRLPGRETRLSERSFSEANLLVNEMAEVISADCNIPYAIFGHSMGAVLAYELALSLRDIGLPQPETLFLSGRIAAHLEVRNKPLHDLPLDSFLAELELRYGGLPRELLADREMLDFYLPILRTDLKLIETYRYHEREPLNCSVMVSAGTDDRSVWEEGLLAWKDHTTGDFALNLFTGGHFYLSSEGRRPFMEYLQAKLKAPHSAT